MLDALRSRFELQGLAIAQIPEALEQQIIETGQILADALLNEHKIIVLGFDDASSIATSMVNELTNSSSIERPPLPSILLNNTEAESTLRQLQALGRSGDVLVILESSSQTVNKACNTLIGQTSNFAQEIGMRSVIIGAKNSESANNASNVSLLDCIQINLDQSSKMNYLCSLTSIALTLNALVDSHLFGQSI